MSAPATVQDFIELVYKSNLQPSSAMDLHFQQLRRSAGIPDTTQKLAGVLIRDGLLTNFQADQLLQGKWRGFGIGPYIVLEQIGAGGMGCVYLCAHKHLGKLMALKVLPNSAAKDPSALQRFYREARAVAALNHPNIVRAYDVGQEDALHFIAMEYVDGASLQDIVKRQGRLSPLRAAHYLRQAALGLQHAFQGGLVHRDIKPGNLMLDRQGTIKLLDLGLARFFDDENDNLTRKFDDGVLGTADYLSPEQGLDSHSVDIRADIYSLGCTGYFLLTGQAPFAGQTVAQKMLHHQMKMPRSVQEFRNDVPANLIAVIDKMMAKDRQVRFQTPLEVAKALEPIARTPIPPPAEGEMPRLCPAVQRAIKPDMPGRRGEVGPVELADPVMVRRNGPNSEQAADRDRRRRAVPFALLILLLFIGVGGAWWCLAMASKPAEPTDKLRAELTTNKESKKGLTTTSPGKATAEPTAKGSPDLPNPLVPMTKPAEPTQRAMPDPRPNSSLPRGQVRISGPTAPEASLDLTQMGELDWVHWGFNDKPADRNRKQGVADVIGAYRIIGGGEAATTKTGAAFSWTDGTPLASVSRRAGGVSVGGSSAFEIPILADDRPKTLKVYVGFYRCQGKVEVGWSNMKTPGYTSTVTSQGAQPSVGVYTIHFRGVPNGPKVFVRLSHQAGEGGYVILQAATLAPFVE